MITINVSSNTSNKSNRSNRSCPAMMKLGTVIPYPKEIQKIDESRDAPLEFC